MKGFKTPWKQLLLTISTILCTTAAFASHIVGGEMAYKCLGNDYYQITLRYYRDCGGVVMPPFTDIEIANPAGTVIQTHNVPKGPSSFLSVNQPGCGQPTPSICIETAQYLVDSVHLPGGLSSYVIFNQECCRNNNVDNVANAWRTGATFPAYLYPSSSVGCNNSPVFGAYPPVAVPLNVPLSIPINASDSDGDSLFFQLCSPLSDAIATPPFSGVSFTPGYSSGNMVPSSPTLSIDPFTGVLSGTPNQLGKFAIGICVNEYRNGVLIGKVRRDYQFTVITPWALFGTITAQTDASCGSGGSATVTAAGASGPYTYNWSNSATTATANNLAVGTHTVIVSNGICSDTATVVINGGASFTTNITNQTTLSCGATTGASATISINGGLPPYNVVWPSGPGGFTNNQLNLGSNKVAVTDNANCTDTVTINILQGGGGVVATIDSIKATSCGTAANGYVSLSGNGGVAPYTFAWSDLATASTRTNLLPRNYGVKVTDANGCSDSISVNVPAGSGLVLTWDSIRDISCAGGSDGYLQPMVSGGTAPYSFSWNTNSSTPSLGNLSAGTYILTVTDAFGCTENIGHDIVEPDSLVLNLNSIKDPSCHNAFDGAIHVGISGGIAPYDILWSTSDTSSTLNNLPSGNYGITVTDSRGCSLSSSYKLSNPDSLWLSFDEVQSILCNGSSDGAIEVVVNGGATPYNYNWSNGKTANLNNNLSAGTYSVTITDNANCSISGQYTLSEPNPLSIQLDSVESSSCGLPNGGAAVNVIGGTAPYNIVWSNSNTGSQLLGVLTGSYTAYVTDSLGCKDSLQVVVPSTSNVTLSLDSTFEPTCGAANGFASVSVNGGVAPYSYTWSNGANSVSSSGLASGIYTVFVKDDTGCEDSIIVNLAAATAPVISFQTAKDPTCRANDGELSIAIAGGKAPYSILWNTSDTSSLLTSLGSGTYSVTVIDSNGCMAASQYTLVSLAPLVINVDTLAEATCGYQNGLAVISVSGGAAPYSVVWSNSQQGNQIFGLAAGTYTAYVTDSIGCTDSISVQVQNLSGFSASLDSIVSPSCFGENDGFAKVVPQGGQAPYSYTWSNGAISDTAMGLAAANYYVIVQDAIGCKDSIHFLLYSPNQLQVAVDSIQNPTCFGGNDGILSIDIQGGNAPYNILWSTSDTVSTLNNLGSGSYGVTVTDSRGCSTTASFTLSNPDSLQIILKNQQNVSCHAANDGAIDVSVRGGTAPYTLLWNNNQLDSSITNLVAGTYLLTLTDANGCSKQASFDITEPQVLSVVLDSTTSETCGQQNGAASISISGGKAPYSVLWNTIQTTPSIQNLSAGKYSATVTDANGCSDSIQFYVGGVGSFVLSLDSTSAPLCAGTNTGFAKVNVTGGTAPFSYSWSNGANTDTTHSLSGGFNYVLVTDALGCQDSLAVNLTDPDSLEIELQSLDHALCNGLSGSISVNVKGGQAPYLVNWSNNVSGQSLLNIKPGTYSVNVTDSKGCSALASYTITEPDSFIVVVDSIKHPTCPGESDGEVYLKALGSANISSIVVNHGKVNPGGVTDLTAGKYSVFVMDSAGCGTNVQFEIKDPQPLVVEDVNVIAPGCDPTDFGFIELAVKGGVAPYTFRWQDGTTTLNHYNVDHGTYTLVVTDAGGCSTTRTFEFLIKDIRLYVNIEELTCASYADAEIEIAVSGAAKPFHLMLNGREVYEGKMNVQSESYVLTLTDAEGCVVYEDFIIDEQKEVKVFFATAFTPDGDGINDIYTIKGSEECFTNATLEVFNRWGAKVFETNEPFAEAWDGTVNGRKAKPDVYLYSFKSNQLTETGHFNILR